MSGGCTAVICSNGDAQLNVPCFLGGHGTGATVALAVGILHPELMSGLILLAPTLMSSLGTWSRSMARRPCTSSVTFPNPLALDMTCRNTAAEPLLKSDRLRFSGRILGCTLRELDELMMWVHGSVHTLTVPYIIQHGKRDLVAHPISARIVLDQTVKLTKHAKTVLYYFNCWHDMLLEPEAEEIVQRGIQWLEERLRLDALEASID